jgi:5'-nucleotidase
VKILLSNDDGVHAEGLHTLHKRLLEFANEVTVIAPDRNCSGASNSLSLSHPLRRQVLNNGFVSINGTPTDCVHIGINQPNQDDPEIVVSGINHGPNLGDDVIYSGTVAAATEGRFMGLPAVAVSLADKRGRYFDTAAISAAKIVKRLSEHPLPADQILNVNVPDIPLDQIRGIKVTRLGKRHRAESMSKQQDPWGREIFWYGAVGETQDAGEGTDFWAIENNFVSVTPLTIDMTAYDSIERVRDWIGEIG